MEGDPATHWLGWQFFRNSPLLQWPLGANPDYGMEIGSSIIFSDSIPLLAFIFKPLGAFARYVSIHRPLDFNLFFTSVILCLEVTLFYSG